MNEALDDLDIQPSQPDLQLLRVNRRSSESEVTEGLEALSFKRPWSSSARDIGFATPQWRGSSTSQPDSFGGITKSKFPGPPGGLFGTAARRRFSSASSPQSRPMSMQGPRYGRQGWKTSESNGEDDDRPKLVSLSDLIRKEDLSTLTYDLRGDGDLAPDTRDTGGHSHQAINGGTVGIQEALEAAEHGNSVRLSKFLQDGGDVATVSRLHHMRWSLLHLAAGCAMMGGRLANYRSRPEPDCNDGYASCVSELLAAGADPNVTSMHGGYTPLMSAALTGSEQCCMLLLRAGAQADKRADDGRTAFEFAQRARFVDHRELKLNKE